MGVRYYDPTLYRFTQMDPVKGQINDPMTLNPYLYAEGDPINNFDPTGMSCLETALTTLQGAFELAFGAAGIAGGVLMFATQPELVLPASELIAAGGALFLDGVSTVGGLISDESASDC